MNMPLNTMLGSRRTRNATLLLVVVALGFEPVVWLVGTWTDPGYAGMGWLPCCAVLLLLIWSMTSPRAGQHDSDVTGLICLGVTASIRLGGQLLDVNVLGALLLCVDVYSIGLIAGVHQRKRSLSPFWLAFLFAFCLPLEPMVQRVLGFGLQQLSANAACHMLSFLYSDLACAGTRITLQEIDLFIDLPCSGARLLSTAGCMFALLCAIYRPPWVRALVAVCLFLCLVLLVNALRIVVLGIGLAEQSWLGFSVMEPGIHELIGLFGVALVTMLLYGLISQQEVTQSPLRPTPIQTTKRARRFPNWHSNVRLQTLCLVVLLPFALSIGALKPRPLDATPVLPPLPAPGVAADFLARDHALTEQESRYFSTFGGSAQRLSYGPFGLLLVNTASPLRHLHDPMVCMTANDFAVTLIGVDHQQRSTVYRATHDQAGEFLLLVSYVSASGRVATSVSEVVWHWLHDPERWLMVQRIVPREEVDQMHEWNASMRRAFNV